MQSIGDILAEGLGRRLDSGEQRTSTTDDFSDLDAYGSLIPSDIAEARGLSSSEPAPTPMICEFCGATLYFLGFVMPSTVHKYGHTIPPRILRWSEEPQRCKCEEAAKKWMAHDAEVERQKRLEQEEIERKRHRKKVARLLSDSGIRKRFQQRTFEKFVTDTPGRKRSYRMAHEYAENFEVARMTGEGLYIEGTNGTGKTHLAAAIGLYLTEREFSVVMKTSFDLLEEIKRAFDDAELSEYKILQAYKECDLLIIDDLGKEQCTDWSMSILYSVINERYEAMRPIIITTNFGSDDLIRTLTPKGYGSQKIEAIISRLREVSRTLTMDWADWRGRKEDT